jgi:hypothetical protein
MVLKIYLISSGEIFRDPSDEIERAYLKWQELLPKVYLQFQQNLSFAFPIAPQHTTLPHHPTSGT